MTSTVAVRERPILFSGPMVRAILDGRKSQTRRVAKLVGRGPDWDWGLVSPEDDNTFETYPTRRAALRDAGFATRYTRTRQGTGLYHYVTEEGSEATIGRVRALIAQGFELKPLPSPFGRCPYGQTGDRLWVRETWQRHPAPRENVVCYAATGCSPKCVSPGHLWRPSIFMPRQLSRLTLEITEVRVERLQEITEADAKAEGVEPTTAFTTQHGLRHRPAFYALWDDLNAKRNGGEYSWDRNPWVWCIAFKRVQP